MDEIMATLLGLERMAWEAYRMRDVDFFSRYLTNDSITVTPFWIANKGTAIKGIATNANPILGFSIEDPHLIVLSKDGLILTYRMMMELQIEGRPVAMPIRATTVYVNINGEWHAAFHQQTPVQS